MRMRGQVQKTPKMVASTGISTHKGISRVPGRKSDKTGPVDQNSAKTPAPPPISRQCRKQMELSNFTLLLWDNLKKGGGENK